MEIESYQRAHEEILIVHEINDQYIEVENFIKNTHYFVKREDGYITDCTCPYHTFRNIICKHQVAVSENTGIPILQSLL